MPDFDIIVIGAGPAGEVLAGCTAAAGLSTAIVEESLVGGECGFYACMPSKALLHPGEVLDEIRHVPGAREAARGQLAVQAVLDNRDSIISDLDDSSQVPWLEDNDISLYRRRGRIAGEMRVRVGDEELFATVAVVIAIGSEPTLPDVEGLSHANPWTNREATTSKIVPGRLLIIGGGVVGAEMAQAYTSLGAKVTGVNRQVGSVESFVTVGDGARAAQIRKASASEIRRTRTGAQRSAEGHQLDLLVDVLDHPPGFPIEPIRGSAAAIAVTLIVAPALSLTPRRRAGSRAAAGTAGRSGHRFGHRFSGAS